MHGCGSECCADSPPPVSNSLSDLIQQLHAVFEKDCVNVDHVQKIMSTYTSCSDDWQQYAKFDRCRYTRNLVDSGNGKFNVMILCWPENISSSIHDHTNAHCFMKVLQGELQEVRFQWPNKKCGTEEMHELGRNSLHLNEVCYINDSLGLHRVTNPSHCERAVSLHVYCPPFTECNAFDQRTGRSSQCRVTFWSQYGRRIKYPNSGEVNAVSPTTSSTTSQCVNTASVI